MPCLAKCAQWVPPSRGSVRVVEQQGVTTMPAAIASGCGHSPAGARPTTQRPTAGAVRYVPVVILTHLCVDSGGFRITWGVSLEGSVEISVPGHNGAIPECLRDRQTSA